MIQRFYYAVRFPYGGKPSMGEANPHTGRYSVACFIKVFVTRQARDKYIENHSDTVAVNNKKDLRQYRLGSSVVDFLEDLRYAQECAINASEQQG